MIRLSKSCVGEEEKIALARVIDEGYLGMGKEVQLFEQEITEFIGTSLSVVCVSTGTAALHLALESLEIGPGDEVLIPSITYVASFQAVAATGAKPIPCDVTTDRVFIDLKDAEKKLTERTKVIMPVHYGSNSMGMEAVYDFAKKFNLRVVEDAAHSFGCYRNGTRIGTSGDIICFSFDGIKNITSGEGGAVLTGDHILARRIMDLRLLGVARDTEMRFSGKRSWDFDVQYRGYRYHMSNLMAAIGREQLKKFPRFSDHRQNCVSRYIAELKGISSIELLRFEYSEITPHIFVIKIMNGYRDALRKFLEKQGIETGLHYKPNHRLTLFHIDDCLENAEKLDSELISLPIHPDLSDEDQTLIISSIKQFFNYK